MSPPLSDERLVALLRAGDSRAFTLIDDRYRVRLTRFARRILGTSHGAVAEDVVQEALLRGYRALLRDDRPIALRPWLHRLVRNCCLDEISRVRTDMMDLEEAGDAILAPAHAEPAVAAERRARLRQLLADLAVLPESQRHALLRREVDGVSHQQLAAELGIREEAVRSLVHRARAGLTKLEVARGTPCADVRDDLLKAYDARRRPTARAVRHLAGCAACRSFRIALRAERRALALLVPAGPLALLLGGGAGLKALAGGGTKGGVAVVAPLVAVAGVGAALGAPHVFRAGDPAPAALRSPALPVHGVARGARLPSGTAVVQRTVAARAGAQRLTCPDGLAVADLLPPRGAAVDAGYAPGTVVGLSRIATVRVRPRGTTAAAGARVTLGILCKKPDRSGSLRWSP